MKKSVVIDEIVHTKLKEITEKTGIKIYKLLEEAIDYLYNKYVVERTEQI